MTAQPTVFSNEVNHITDQPYRFESGRLTENGKFFEAAKNFKENKQPPEAVRVYEKIKTGIWTDNGLFRLVDAWEKNDDSRSVFKFKLESIDGPEDESEQGSSEFSSPGRLIPSSVKQEVFKRDEGRCMKCGAEDELHFDHIIPHAKGGTSVTAENIQLLCARHNLQKSAKIV